MADPISSFSVVARDGKPVNEVIIPEKTGKDATKDEPKPDNIPSVDKNNGQDNDSTPSSDTTIVDKNGESELNKEQKKDAVPPTNPISETPDQIIEKAIVAKTNGAYKNVDDLINEISSLKSKPAERNFKDDYIKKIVDYYESTGSLEPVLKALTTDYSKISDDAIFKMELREKYPNLSDKAFEKIYKREVIDKYNLDEENNEPDDVEIGRELMKHDAQQLREAKIKAQAEFKIPENNQSQGQPPDTNLSAAYEAWKNQVVSDPSSNDLLSNKRIVVKHEGGDFNFELSDPAKVVEMGYNDKEFFKLFLTADGKVDLAKFYKVASYAQNMETFEKSLITHGKSIGKNEVLDSIKNKKVPESEGGTTPPADESDSKIGLLKAFAAKGVHTKN